MFRQYKKGYKEGYEDGKASVQKELPASYNSGLLVGYRTVLDKLEDAGSIEEIMGVVNELRQALKTVSA